MAFWNKSNPAAVESSMNSYDNATAAGNKSYQRAALQDAADAAAAVTAAGGKVPPDVQARLDEALGR